MKKIIPKLDVNADNGKILLYALEGGYIISAEDLVKGGLKCKAVISDIFPKYNEVLLANAEKKTANNLGNLIYNAILCEISRSDDYEAIFNEFGGISFQIFPNTFKKLLSIRISKEKKLEMLKKLFKGNPYGLSSFTSLYTIKSNSLYQVFHSTMLESIISFDGINILKYVYEECPNVKLGDISHAFTLANVYSAKKIKTFLLQLGYTE